MHPCLVYLIPGVLLCTLLFSLLLKKADMPRSAAWTTLLAGAVLGFVMSKLVYVLCLISRLYPRYGMGAFTRMTLTEFSFVGGALGAVLGAVLCAGVHRIPVKKMLDVFAPVGALLAAWVKGGEYFLDMHGVGAYLENESLYFFPLAVKNEWDEYFLAVFMIYAIFALIVAVISLAFSSRREGSSKMPGLNFCLTSYHLAIILILCENLRVQTIKWGFVKAEQLFGALILLSILLPLCIRAYRKSPMHTDGPTSALTMENGKLKKKNTHASFIGCFWPVAALFLCAGLLIVVEFALDGKIAMGQTAAYGLMALTLAAMSLLGLFTARRVAR
ncbi:MAG: prolipoprotein diacylglyceryl transferase [Clostridia bacterium]|nr:prolipoprotein diacylglyceryl transferase [Clostridia bacterium]